MLNVPNSVKTLYQTDGVRKNFRVHFPNGEFSDITNDNVVQESVKFTESLCSQSTFKFGLAEASVLEFETVGIGNMYGMTIEASIEIDCSSLSAADKATIAAGTWDGTWDAVAEVFGIPLGTFRVDKCPRNHGAMAHRQVTAYYKGLTASGVSNPYQTKSETVMASDTTAYTPSIKSLAFSHLYQTDPDALLNEGYTKTPFQAYTGLTWLYDIARETVKLSGGSTRTFRVRAIYQRYDPSSTDFKYALAGCMENFASQRRAEAETFITQFLTSYNVDPVASGYADLTTMVNHFIGEMEASPNGYVHARQTYSNATIRGDKEWAITEANMPYLVYPHRNDTAGGGICFLTLSGLRLVMGSTPTANTPATEYTFDTSPESFYMYQKTTPDALDNISITLESTLQTAYLGVNYYSFANAYSVTQYLSGYLELLARFIKPNRISNSNEIVQLDNTSPLAIVPDEYSEMWWDEYDVDPIGTVGVTFQETSGDGATQESTSNITVGVGSSFYDMSNNEMLKKINLSLADITSLINTYFVPNIGMVAFTPTELTMQGWPWLEAGDALEIEAEDGTIVETYALRVEMSGIQHLQSVITAEGGEIIDGVPEATEEA